MRLESLHQKMFTRRNWLLRCSILINIAVILYICSHVMIGGSNNFNSGPSFLLPEAQQLLAKETPLTKNVSFPFNNDVFYECFFFIIID